MVLLKDARGWAKLLCPIEIQLLTEAPLGTNFRTGGFGKLGRVEQIRMDTENQERISEARKKASPTKRLGRLAPREYGGLATYAHLLQPVA